MRDERDAYQELQQDFQAQSAEVATMMAGVHAEKETVQHRLDDAERENMPHVAKFLREAMGVAHMKARSSAAATAAKLKKESETPPQMRRRPSFSVMADVEQDASRNNSFAGQSNAAPVVPVPAAPAKVEEKFPVPAVPAVAAVPVDCILIERDIMPVEESQRRPVLHEDPTKKDPAATLSEGNGAVGGAAEEDSE